MELQSLQSIFNNKIFRIPDYQRGYSWGKQQLQDLWRDIDILDVDQPHYTGVLSVISKGNQVPKNLIHVVDGQQRLATLIILIQAICYSDQLSGKERVCDCEKKDYEKKYLHRKIGETGNITEVIFGYEIDNPSHIYFKTKILGLPDMDSSVPEHTLYTRNLDTAKKFFANKIKSMTFEESEVLLKKITEQLKFNYYKIDNELNEFVAFETMNNRGKPLSDLELLKNRLIYLSTLLPDNDKNEKSELRKDINNVWKTVYEYLGKNPDKVLNDDDFLRDHWVMCFQYSRSGARIYKDFLLNEHFTAENVQSNKLKLTDIKKYVTDIQKVVRSYYWMHNPSDSNCRYSDSTKKWLSKLERLGFRTFKPLVASTLSNQTAESRILPILKFAEQFCFVAFSVHFHNSNKGDIQIYKLTHKFHKHPDKLDANTISKLFNLKSVGISTDRMKDKFCENIYERYPAKFYKWNGINYFLYEYELHLKESNNLESRVDWEKVNAETIEHIYPQSPNHEEWKNFKPNDDKHLKHDLGNLLLLSHKKNAELQNSSFAEKKKKFRFPKHSTIVGSYSAIEVYENDDWTPATILARREKMLDFLWCRWGLSGRARLKANITAPPPPATKHTPPQSHHP